MTYFNVRSYEIKTSKTGYKIPVVNDVHLHSVYNPEKEAISLADKNSLSLEANNEVLILGLGFGYHIKEVINRLRDKHGEDFKIVVIEPNSQVTNDCLALNPMEESNLFIFSGEEISSLYKNVQLVNFLIRKPTVIAHPPSFNLYSEYFKNMLSFKAPRNISNIVATISNQTVRGYLSNSRKDQCLDQFIVNDIDSKNKLTSDMDFLAIAYGNLTKDISNNLNGEV